MTEISFFYNHITQETVNAPCPYYYFDSWALNNANLLGLDAQGLSQEHDTKRFAKLLNSQSWSYGAINNNSCHIEAANIELGKDMLYRILEQKTFESAHFNLQDLHRFGMDNNELSHFLTTGNFHESVFKTRLESNQEINSLMVELNKLDCLDQMYVFGSVTKGKLAPPDLDIWIDSTKTPMNPITQEKILELAEKFLGCLDPYIRTPNGLLALGLGQSVDVYHWVDLKNENRIWEKIEEWDANQKSSIPLRDLQPLPTTFEGLFPQKKKSLKM